MSCWYTSNGMVFGTCYTRWSCFWSIWLQILHADHADIHIFLRRQLWFLHWSRWLVWAVFVFRLYLFAVTAVAFLCFFFLVLCVIIIRPVSLKIRTFFGDVNAALFIGLRFRADFFCTWLPIKYFSKFPRVSLQNT